MNSRTARVIAKLAHSCRCNFCLLEKAREILQQQESRDLSLETAVTILEGLLRSGSGTVLNAFPHYLTTSWRASGEVSGPRPTVTVTLPEGFTLEEDGDY